MRRLTSLFTIATLAGALPSCGGGSSGTSPTSAALGVPAGLQVQTVPEIGNKNSAAFTWIAASNAASQTIEIGRASGGKDVATIQVAGSATTHTQMPVPPVGVLYARVVATAGSQTQVSNEVQVGSYDPRQIIDATLLGSGPLAVAGNAGCGIGIFDGFPSGTVLSIEGTSTLTTDQQTALRDTAAQVATLTAGDQSANAGIIADPGPAVVNPGTNRMVIRLATQAEVSAQCGCTNCVGCASSFYRGVQRTGVFMQALSTSGGPTVAHEIGHGIGFCHIISAVGINPPMTLGITTDGVFSPNGRISKIDPVMAKAMQTAYTTGLRPRGTRNQFLAAGLVSDNYGAPSAGAASVLPYEKLPTSSDRWAPFRGKTKAQQIAIAELWYGKGARVDFDDKTEEVRVTKPICAEGEAKR